MIVGSSPRMIIFSLLRGVRPPSDEGSKRTPGITRPNVMVAKRTVNTVVANMMDCSLWLGTKYFALVGGIRSLRDVGAVVGCLSPARLETKGVYFQIDGPEKLGGNKENEIIHGGSFSLPLLLNEEHPRAWLWDSSKSLLAGWWRGPCLRRLIILAPANGRIDRLEMIR